MLMVMITLGMLSAWSRSESAAEEAMPADLLQNGLDGWTVDGAREVQDGDQRVAVWTYADGVVTCFGKGFGFLRYQKELADFRLALEYRFPKKGNSGIGIRTGTFTGAASTRPSFAAYEVQLLSDAGTPPSPGACASLYRYVAPRVNASRPVGEWNSMVIECRGPRVRIIHNDVDVMDFDQTTKPETAAKPLRGNVCLQNHGSRVEFRKILLTELADR